MIAKRQTKHWWRRKDFSVKEKRKWDAVLTVLLFVFALIASVLFNFLSQSEPLIANSGY